MAWSRKAQSSTVRAIGPVWSSVQDSVMTPARLERPYVGLIPAMPQKAAGPRIEPRRIGPGSPGDEAGGQRGARAAAGAAGNVVEVPRIASGGKLVPGELDAEGELVGDELAEQHRARLLPASHRRGVGIGNPFREECGAAGGADAAGEVDVLVGDGNAEERILVAASESRFRRPCVLESTVGGEGNEGEEERTGLLDAGEERAGHLRRGDLALAIARAQLADGRVEDLVTHGRPPWAPPRTSRRALPCGCSSSPARAPGQGRHQAACAPWPGDSQRS